MATISTCSNVGGLASDVYPCQCAWSGFTGPNPIECFTGQVCVAAETEAVCQDEHHIAIYKKMVFDLLFILVLLMVYRAFSRLKLTKPKQKNNNESNQQYWERKSLEISHEDPTPGAINGIAEKVQTALHSNPVTAFLGQWYVLLYLVIMGLGMWNMVNVFFYDYEATHWLSKESIETTMHHTDPDGLYFTPEKRDALRLSDHPFLRKLSLAAPIATLVGLIVLGIHFGLDCHVLYNQHRWAQKRERFPWNAGSRSEMVLIVIAVPGLYMVMAVRSVCRMWMVMRGYHKGGEAATDLALYNENFSLAAVCMYFAVAVFANLCISILKDSNPIPDMVKAMRLVGFQGLYGWVFLGSFQSALLFFIAYVNNHPGHCFTPGTDIQIGLTDGHCTGEQRGVSVQTIAHIENKVLPALGTAVSIFSLIATYNMLVVCKLNFIDKALGQANAKFTGTKILLILGPNQLKILNMFTAGAAWEQRCAAKFATGSNKYAMCVNVQTMLGLSPERAKLLHASLLCFECMIIIMLNFAFWTPRPFVAGNDDNISGDDSMKSTQTTGESKKSGMQKFLAREYIVDDMRKEESIKQPLLG